MEDTTTQEAAAAPPPPPDRPSSALVLRTLQDYTVGAIPTLFYVPDFISQSEQSQVLHHVRHPSNPRFSFYLFLDPTVFDAVILSSATQIYQAPAPKWKSLKNRRLQNWGTLSSWNLI
jgi:alkylated DNA repair protein alkB family protein 6